MTDYTKKYLKYKSRYLKNKDEYNGKYDENGGILDYFFNDTEHLNKIKSNQDKITEFSMKTYALIMDIYFLRRFLDKTYINNGIIYCGFGHAIRYIHILIKEFNFKITHASYLNKPIGLVNEILRNYDVTNNIDNDDDIKKIFSNYDLLQCADVSSFPANFS